MIFQNLKNSAFLANKKIGLAVSGGVDSMVLLDYFLQLKKIKNIDIFVLHYNHKWRKESYRDVQLVNNYCKKNMIKFVYKEAKGKVIKNEETARNERYSFFKSVAKKYKLDFICTAHHKDDHCETVIFRLLRGTGPAGLLPLKEFLNLTNKTVLFRPFLSLTKNEIVKYAQNKKIPFIEDKTNEDIKYKRNLIRKKIIPLFDQINNKSVENLLRCSDLIYSCYSVLGSYFDDLLDKISLGNKYTWNRKRFLQFDEYTQKTFLYWFLTKYEIPGSLNKINLFLDVVNNCGKLELSKDFYVCSDKNRIFYKQKAYTITDAKKKKSAVRIVLNGKRQKIGLQNKSRFVVYPFSKQFFNREFPCDNTYEAYVDLSNYKNKTFTIRHREEKDIFQPLGFPQPIKLKKYLINKKIPKEKRYNLPLLCFNNEVLWIPGYAMSNKLKVKHKPTHILKIKKDI